MTQEYLVGELSILLARLQALLDDEELVRAVGRLRSEAENRGLCGLADTEMRALNMTDQLCWASLASGNASAFERIAEAGAELREFGVSSGILPSG
jgi:hypothetical protein